MSEKITLDSLGEKLDFFHQMYDAVRLVDPIEKRVLEYSGHCMEKTDKICYAYWQNGHICDNCISVRAYRKRRSFIKLECTPCKIMLVTALPIESAERPVILELLKDTTDTMLLGSGEYEKGQKFYAAVKDFNKMVIMDGLTSVYNRRFLNDRLPADISASILNKGQLSVIFLDIDNMKAINDTFGHAVGDRIIQRSAKIIQTCIRQDSDWVARYGGDEFFVCLNRTGDKEAGRIAKRIRDEFENCVFPVKDKNVTISVSQGIVTMPEQGCTADEIIKLSDRKMYEEKKRSRLNRGLNFTV